MDRILSSDGESPTQEAEFVLGLLRRVGNGEKVDSRLREIAAADPDWDVIVDLCSRHRLYTVLRQTIDDADIVAPEAIRTMLEGRGNEQSIHNLQHSRQLHEVLDLLGSNDIAALPYKGPVLAEAVYGSVGDRSFGDLDLLVATRDVTLACELLERHGYERMNFTEVPVKTLVDGTVFRWGEEFRFADTDGGLPVELRFGFIGGSRPDEEIFANFWERRTQRTLAGRSLSTLSTADRALLLLVHGTKHGWRQLSWVYDVAMAYEQGVNWDIVVARAKEYRWLKAVVYGMKVLTELTGCPPPKAVQSEIESSRLCSWGATQTAAQLRTNPRADLTYLEPVTTAMFLNDNLSGALVDGLHEVFAPRKSDYEWVSLPPRLHALYYGIRPVHLFVSSLQRFTRR